MFLCAGPEFPLKRRFKKLKQIVNTLTLICLLIETTTFFQLKRNNNIFTKFSNHSMETTDFGLILIILLALRIIKRLKGDSES